MSDINLDFTVSNNEINFTVEPNDITFTPDATTITFFAGGIGLPGGSTGQLQYNNGGVLGGVNNTNYNGTNLTLGNIANIKITGGSNTYAIVTDGLGNLSFQSIANANFSNFSNVAYHLNATSTSNIYLGGGLNGYYLQTDGAGNLTWSAGTGGGGNGSPGGANTQVQFNDAGVFGGDIGFVYNKTTNLLNVDNITIANNANSSNVNTANLNVTNLSNLGAVGTVKIFGGTSGQVITTDGAGNLSFTQAQSGTDWSNVSNIAVNDIFMGRYVGPNLINAGSNASITSNLNLTSWTLVTTPTNISGVESAGNYISAATGSTSLRYTTNGIDWNAATTTISATRGAKKGSNNYVIFQNGSNRVAYANTINGTYSNVTLPGGSKQWEDTAYGNSTWILIASEPAVPIFQKSTNDGLTWSNVTGMPLREYRSIDYGNGTFIASAYGSNVFIKSTDNGNTWANTNVGANALWHAIAYGNNKWVAVSENTSVGASAKATCSTDDGNTWTTSNLSNRAWTDITYANGYFVATAAYSNVIAYTTNGTTWTEIQTTASNIGDPAGSITFNYNTSILLIGAHLPASTANIIYSDTPRIDVYDSGGNNSLGVPFGNYRCLGGGLGNVGGLWKRLT